MAKERAQKVIAQSGVMSRRKAEEAIAEGRVTLNGEVFTQMGTLVEPETDLLTVDGNPVQIKTVKRTFLFYKPRDIVTTKKDEFDRPTVMEYFKDIPSVNPVGRLDADSEGLLLMSEDGDLHLKLTHPRYEIEKVYEVDVEDRLLESTLAELTKEVILDDGPGHFDRIEFKGEAGELRDSTYLVTVSEGRNRFVRRMFQAMGTRVSRLKRIRMGEFEIGELKPGERIEVFPKPQNFDAKKL
jgi:23S rRNA pseudouridine2605 synthase